MSISIHPQSNHANLRALILSRIKLYSDIALAEVVKGEVKSTCGGCPGMGCRWRIIVPVVKGYLYPAGIIGELGRDRLVNDERVGKFNRLAGKG
jgi:hypothetical protein